MKKLFLLLLCLIPILLFGAEYAAMYINEGTAQTGNPLFTGGTYYNVSGFTTSSTSTEWSFASNTLTNTSGGGLYYVKFSLSFTGAEAIWNARILVGGVGYAETVRSLSSTRDVGNISGGCLIQINNGQTINLQVQADVDVDDFEPDYAQIAAYEINETSNPNYAEIYTTTEATISGISTSWVNITGFSQGELNGWTFSSNALTASASAAGTYFVLFGLSMSSNSADLAIGISKNGATPTLAARRIVNNSTDFGNAHVCGIITVAENDNITLKTRTFNGSKNLTTHFSDLVLIPISGSTDAPYGSMDIDGNTNGVTLSSGWQKEANQTNFLTDSNNWTFSSVSNDLTPTGLSAGKYLLSYNIGITYPNPGALTEAIEVDAGISIGGTVVEKSRVLRTLQKSENDFGSASSNAIITIADTGDVVALELKEHSGLTFPVAVTYSNISLIRIETNGSGEFPVHLTSFSWHQISRDEVELKWDTASESDVLGYNIYRDITASGVNQVKCNSHIVFAEHSPTGNSYSFVDESIYEYPVYYYWIESTSYDGVSVPFGPYYVPIDQGFGSDDSLDNSMIGYYIKNYPNPFNPLTTVSYYLESDSNVQISIYNLKGQKIYGKGLTPRLKGKYSFIWNAEGYASGTYLIRLETDLGTIISKATLLK
ncbi:MAG: T9SS type A sorting domain-containing protein [Candidatus Zophobacter franzmannii]|nr:T9SS type A sorting domain-containing protein [Candidatus Zophobacter franzmannii]